MRQLLIIAAVAAVSLSSCKVFTSLTSSTYIEPQKTFLLGEGQHDSYIATVTNTATSDVEVIQTDAESKTTSLGILKPRQTETYSVPANTAVRFKNLGKRYAELGIKLKGATGLSMGYRDNQK